MASEMKIIELQNTGEYQSLLKEPVTSGMRAGRVYLKPGEECGEHTTGPHEETLIFLTGTGTALIGPNKTPHKIGEGKISYIPPHTIHNIKNTGTVALTYIYCVAPVKE